MNGEQSDTISYIVEILAAALVPVAGVVGAWLARKGAKLLNIRLEQEQLRQVEQFIVQGIHFAEEQAAKAAKAGKALPGEEKKRAAVDYVKQALSQDKNRKKIAKVVGDGLADMVEAVLNRQRHESGASSAPPEETEELE